MAKAQKFEDLAIFQKARDLCKEVYAITKEDILLNFTLSEKETMQLIN